MATATEEKVKQIIVEQLGVDEGEVTSNASFVDDLGADSLDTVELVMAFEEAFEIQIPDEIKNFDPLQFIEKKELKKMGRFIHLALAAADEAMKASGLDVTPEISERGGVHIGSGIGG